MFELGPYEFDPDFEFDPVDGDDTVDRAARHPRAAKWLWLGCLCAALLLRRALPLQC